jgi:hypothetical protein
MRKQSQIKREGAAAAGFANIDLEVTREYGLNNETGMLNWRLIPPSEPAA